MDSKMLSTTVVCIRRNGSVAIGSDGQVTLGNTVVKHGAVKIRKLFNDRVLAGFAGASGDAFTLLERFEVNLKKYSGNLMRASYELTRDWRTDKVLRRLEAMIIVADAELIYILSGNGDMIEPENGIAAIGSGGPYALSAATALMNETELSAEEIVKKSLEIAGSICIYTNKSIKIMTLQ